jgi:hypothetical protein
MWIFRQTINEMLNLLEQYQDSDQVLTNSKKRFLLMVSTILDGFKEIPKFLTTK